MTIIQGWRCRHEPTHRRNERYVGTYAGIIVMAGSIFTLRQKIEAVMEAQYA